MIYAVTSVLGKNHWPSFTLWLLYTTDWISGIHLAGSCGGFCSVSGHSDEENSLTCRPFSTSTSTVLTEVQRFTIGTVCSNFVALCWLRYRGLQFELCVAILSWVMEYFWRLKKDDWIVWNCIDSTSLTNADLVVVRKGGLLMLASAFEDWRSPKLGIQVNFLPHKKNSSCPSSSGAHPRGAAALQHLPSLFKSKF
jgi:hypothetical protein